jgi:DNA-3-methyladenine glycosylase II
MNPTLNNLARKYLLKVDPILAAVIRRLPEPQTKRRRANFFRSLAEAIIAQQVSNKAAETITLRFRNLFGSKTFPKPSEILKMRDDKIRTAGLSYSKIIYIKEIAKAIESKQLDFRKMRKLDDELIIEELVKIKGVGRWTAEMFLMFTLERPDIFSHGDLGLRNAIHKLYGFKKPPTKKQIEKIIAKWSPHKTLASRYLWKSVDLK